MKKILISLMVLTTFSIASIPQVFAGYVNGYYRSNGTYVNGYYRTEADGNPYNNYSYPGNYNPNTGSITGGNADTYLNNYYKNSSGSTYSPSYSSYSYPTTPTCPSNSYYDGISSCKCSYGYSVSGGSCVSNYTQCQNQMGYSSSYDSLNNTCKCNSGYVIGSSGQCKLASLVCSDQIGLMSQYNSSTKKCECMSGYEYDGSSCKYKTNKAYSATEYSNISSCPLNFHESLTNTNKCECDSGYKINGAKNACVVDIVSSSISNTGGELNCSSYGSGAKLYGNLCYCSSGYMWNTSINSCIIGSPTFSKNITFGSSGADVVNLKNILGVAGVYTGYVNSAFDADTFTAIKLYQTLHGLPSTGMVGPLTRGVLNSAE